MTQDPAKSELQLALEKRPRPTWTIEAPDFLAKGAPVSGSLRMRVLTVSEHSAAVLEAVRTARELAKDLGLDSDPDFMLNYKTACAMQRACLQADKEVPAFKSGSDLMRLLTAGELGLLAGQYTNVLRLHGPGEPDLDAEKAESLSLFLANADPSQSMGHLLNMTAANLALLSILLSVKVQAVIGENQTLRAQVQALLSPLPEAAPE